MKILGNPSKKRNLQSHHRFLAMLVFLLWAPDTWGINVTKTEYKGTLNPPQLVIVTSDKAQFETSPNEEKKQWILELKNTVIPSFFTQRIDTTGFGHNLILITPFNEGSSAKWILQFTNEIPKIDLAQTGNTLSLSIPSGSAVPKKESLQLSPLPRNPASEGSVTQDSEQGAKLITLQVKDAEIADVFRLIQEASGFNIILSDQIQGRISLSIVQAPWDQALEVLLKSLHLGAERKDNLLRIAPLMALAREKTEEYLAKQAAKMAEPRITHVFHINYAKLSEVADLVSRFLGTQIPSTAPDPLTQSPDHAQNPSLIIEQIYNAEKNQSLPATREQISPNQPQIQKTSQPMMNHASNFNPNIQMDERTSSLIVYENAENIEKIKKILEIIDVQVPQVLIEAKIVEGTDLFSKSLQGSFGISNQGNTGAYLSTNGLDPIDPLITLSGNTGSSITPTSFSLNPGGTFGLDQSISFLPFGQGRINAMLQILETESKAKIVASPRTIVLNKEHATIVQGTPVLVPTFGTTALGATIPLSVVQNANITLEVTPTVTTFGHILMDLNVTKNEVETLSGSSTGAGVAPRSMQTKVLVETGTTLVIGGIYSHKESNTESGVPFLRRIPLLGALFSQDSSSRKRTQLFIFVSPKILNPRIQKT